MEKFPLVQIQNTQTDETGDAADLMGEESGEATIPLGSVRTRPAWGLINLRSNSGSIFTRFFYFEFSSAVISQIFYFEFSSAAISQIFQRE